MLRVLDLFAGLGGFSLGLHWAGGFSTAAFCFAFLLKMYKSPENCAKMNEWQYQKKDEKPFLKIFKPHRKREAKRLFLLASYFIALGAKRSLLLRPLLLGKAEKLALINVVMLSNEEKKARIMEADNGCEAQITQDGKAAYRKKGEENQGLASGEDWFSVAMDMPVKDAEAKQNSRRIISRLGAKILISALT